MTSYILLWICCLFSSPFDCSPNPIHFPPGVWVTLADRCSFKPTMTAVRLQPPKAERNWSSHYCLLLFVPFLSLLSLPRTVYNSQLKGACQGKAKPNGAHCFDLLFSLERGHEPILPDCFVLFGFASINSSSYLLSINSAPSRTLSPPLSIHLPAALKKCSRPH